MSEKSEPTSQSDRPAFFRPTDEDIDALSWAVETLESCIKKADGIREVAFRFCMSPGRTACRG